MTGWTPIVDGAAAAIVRDACDAIARRLVARPIADDRVACSLMTGDAGVAIFLAYYARARGDDAAMTRAGDILERAIDVVPAIADKPNLYSGFVGTAWAVEHLRDMFGIEPALNDGLDAALIDILDARPDWSCFEWLSGVAGCGVYALERLPSGGVLLERIAGELERLGESTPIGMRWRRPAWMIEGVADRFPDGCYALDPAHGALGPIGVLAGCAAGGIGGAREAAVASVRALETQRFSSNMGPLFRQYANDVEAGLGWCRGDPGAAGVLSAAGAVLGEPSWSAIARVAAERVAAMIGLVPAAGHGGLCHGLAGVAHVLHRVAKRSLDEPLARVAADALVRVARSSSDDTDECLITGIAGTGLALLAASTSIDPGWDRALLLSHRYET
jgi:hypothetical protein